MDRDKEIYGIAKVYLREHGEDAVIEAAILADALLEAGDLDGQRVWMRVIEAIKELADAKLPEGNVVHWQGQPVASLPQFVSGLSERICSLAFEVGRCGRRFPSSEHKAKMGTIKRVLTNCAQSAATITQLNVSGN